MAKKGSSEKRCSILCIAKTQQLRRIDDRAWPTPYSWVAILKDGILLNDEVAVSGNCPLPFRFTSNKKLLSVLMKLMKISND